MASGTYSVSSWSVLLQRNWQLIALAPENHCGNYRRKCERCTELGYRQMVAVIGGRETIASIRLHEALGFTHIGVFPAIGFKFGRWVDTVLMQRALGVGADTLPTITPAG